MESGPEVRGRSRGNRKMKLQLRALLRQISELGRQMEDAKPAESLAPKALGIDAILPDGWAPDAHRTGRSPWDGELQSRLYLDSEQSLFKDVFDKAPARDDGSPSARVAPDRRTTELDWRRVTTPEN